MTLADLVGPALGFVAGIGFAVVVYFILHWKQDRPRPGRVATEPPLGARESADPTPSAVVPVSDPPDGPTPAPRSAAGPTGSTPDSPRPVGPAPSMRVPRETLRLSHRVVLHLGRQPRWTAYQVAAVELTQLGMTQRLSVAQTALTKVLRRLIAAGVVVEYRSHVSGQPRRLKIYQLTPLGEALARDLRRRSPPPVPSWARAGAAPGSLPPTAEPQRADA